MVGATMGMVELIHTVPDERRRLANLRRHREAIKRFLDATAIEGGAHAVFPIPFHRDVSDQEPTELDLSKSELNQLALTLSVLGLRRMLDEPQPLTAEGAQRAIAAAFYEPLRRARFFARKYAEAIDRAIAAAPARRKGRSGADASGLLRSVARQYERHLNARPVSTQGGAFHNVATIVLAHHTGRMPRDVSRQVRAALKKKN